MTRAAALSAAQPPAQESEQRLHRLLLLGLALAAIAVYANSLWNGFAYDDDWIILRNDRVHQLRDLGRIWGTPYWPTFGKELGLYRPLTIFFYALQWALGGGAPWIYHLVNVLLHVLVTAFVFLLLRRFVAAWPAALGALVFAVHPVHTEVVANAVGQAELWAAAGMLGACLIHSGRQPGLARYPWPRFWAVAALYFAMLFAKEAAITLPALLVLFDVAQRRVGLQRASLLAYLREIWLLLYVLAGAALLYLSVRADVLGSIGGLDAAPALPFLREEHRVLTALRAWPEYVRLLFLPRDLSADYSPAVILPVESLTPMASLGALLLAGTVLFALATPRKPLLGFPAAWFIITIITVSNLLFPIGVVVAERTLYMPSIAVSAIVAFAWHSAQPAGSLLRRRLATAALVVAVALLSVRTVARNPDWKNTGTLLHSLMRDHPESYRTAWFMAHEYWRRGDVAQSRFYWEAALLLWPRDSQLMNEFANFSIGQGDWKRAVELLERSRAIHPWVPRTHELLAFSYVNAGRPADARAAARTAIGMVGPHGLLFAITARAFEAEGQHDRAIAAWGAATRARDGQPWAYHAMYARALARAGDQSLALAAIRRGLQANPDNPAVHALIENVARAIRDGCYGRAAALSCADPLVDWRFTADAPTVLQNGEKSQNAKPGPPAPSPGAAADKLP